MAAPGARLGLIRKAFPEDAAAIARVHVDAWRTTYAGIVPDAHLAALSYADRERRWAEILDGPSLTVVVEEGGTIVGFANGGPNRGPEADYPHELYAIYVLRERQGRGLGRRLTLALALPRPWIVWVLRDNPARGFYLGLGGRPAGSKTVEIGGRALEEIAFGFPRLFRPFEPRDTGACLALFDGNSPAFFAPDDRTEFAAFLERPAGPYLVGEREGRVVACGGWYLDGDRAGLAWGMVDRSLHATGLGRELLLERLGRIRAEGRARVVRIRTTQKVQGFYERFGFAVVSAVHGGFGPGLDRVEMELAP